jgi:excinuclease ABC subunit A
MPKQFECLCGCNLSTYSDPTKIVVHGAKERNLKNICFEIPKGKLTVLTGPSGSGKSSIAIEVLQKECLRQYLESLGMTTDHITKAKVDSIRGLSPAIGVSQRVSSFNPRSTVGTKTGVLTLLRTLYASIGQQRCPECEKCVRQPLQSKGKLVIVEEDPSSKKKGKRSFECPSCGLQLEKLEMAHFSFNAILGACEVCKGTGEKIGVDISRLIDEEKTIKNGGVAFWDEGVAKYYEGVIQTAAKYYNFSIDTNLPIRNYTKEQKDFLLYGVAFPPFVKAHKNIKEPKKVSDGKFEGIIPYLLARYKSNPSKLPEAIKKYISHEPCTHCQNTRLGKMGRSVTISGKTIVDVAQLNLFELLGWINTLEEDVSEDEWEVFRALSDALKERISNVIEVGLDYLSLDRPLPTLSAGESQRLKLACVLGSGLTGVLYILDEPTTGLHPHDTVKLLKTLRKIQEAGNTILVIEHDPSFIREMDYMIELGPNGGSRGGEIIFTGTLSEVMGCEESITARYLGEKGTIGSSKPVSGNSKILTVYGVSEHNLRHIDVSIPVNKFVVMTGVSGSGKSTFLFDVLDKAARKYLNRADVEPGEHDSIHGLEYFHRVVTVDQSTIRNTQSLRSNVATYTKLFDLIRDVFASTTDAKIRGFGAGKFSFNTSDERCENCNGAGMVAIDMAFMPDVEIECPICCGMRFNEELLSIKFRGVNIADVLGMTVDEAIVLFNEHQHILAILDLMKQVGLDYLTLGQSTSALSGGEAQRIKLAAELSKSTKESTLYLLDEPTTGLHPHEVEKLIQILKKLVFKGNTVVTIEHHLDVICKADTIIDFGPGGGIAGGEIVAVGFPQEIAENQASLTGQCLRSYFTPLPP